MQNHHFLQSHVFCLQLYEEQISAVVLEKEINEHQLPLLLKGLAQLRVHKQSPRTLGWQKRGFVRPGISFVPVDRFVAWSQREEQGFGLQSKPKKSIRSPEKTRTRSEKQHVLWFLETEKRSGLPLMKGQEEKDYRFLFRRCRRR
eukprot:TRINITY_DN1815_c0_g4_i3.p2 TRINITY_DN1815_c0_g4~~TRINITY_DN1815_c0_g4_i3.p2  ORF type:complete len:145 (+),score=27.70 TRINITY_DN1815_c0_g4_i3:220-654(+)